MWKPPRGLMSADTDPDAEAVRVSNQIRVVQCCRRQVAARDERADDFAGLSGDCV